MTLSVLLKKIVALRKKKDSKGNFVKETEWIKGLFIVAGAEYIFEDENKGKGNTLLKHIFAPTSGRTAISQEIANVILDKEITCYWKTFNYLKNTMDYTSNDTINSIKDIITLIFSEEDMLKNINPEYRRYDYGGYTERCPVDVFFNLCEESSCLIDVCLDIITEYYYFLTFWEIRNRNINNTYIVFFRPNLTEIIDKHIPIVNPIDKSIFREKKISVNKYTSYSAITIPMTDHNVRKKLFFPPSINKFSLSPMDYQYNNEFKNFELKTNVFETEYITKFLNDYSYFLVSSSQAVFLWNLSEDPANYKVNTDPEIIELCYLCNDIRISDNNKLLFIDKDKDTLTTTDLPEFNNIKHHNHFKYIDNDYFIKDNHLYNYKNTETEFINFEKYNLTSSSIEQIFPLDPYCIIKKDGNYYIIDKIKEQKKQINLLADEKHINEYGIQYKHLISSEDYIILILAHSKNPFILSIINVSSREINSTILDVLDNNCYWQSEISIGMNKNLSVIINNKAKNTIQHISYDIQTKKFFKEQTSYITVDPLFKPKTIVDGVTVW